MHQPTKAQVQVVIDTLRKSLSIVGNGLDMDNAELCGTYLCHGGHYAIAKGLDEKGYSYFHGIHLMVLDLGFERNNNLTDWANANPDIWGNEFGGYMFSNKRAFINHNNPNGAETLEDIIHHWELVQTRCPD